ncbi:High temperature protein G [Anaerococcus prevotii]|uniref:Chaperone protein HtpG n=1 Tax=Anaerococcus prevotii (strain ATCC 9321 / DSM 20548 / JCM 6508 / NCTC 11806 / PC1) TaxID=525919 RepID=C7RG39_ANAPD|nr:molecular chaperone HtpG [Anaerococcus prevotii]ACV28450.1 heat shock protein Hsp90 [Anaerococcus prevotii DSM 20548]SUU94009.1 High temperature protein G [Anaerococcus prevotii]
MKKEFKAEAKKVMDLMINSIYTNKEIFLRELISNASDALDKLYYKDLKSDNSTDKSDYYIELIPNKDERSLTIRDTGIGMNETDLTENLGTIAKSGTEAFRKSVEDSDIKDLIGQFGVGFYSAFMVADKIEVLTKKFGEDEAYLWESVNAESYEISKANKEGHGTDIKLFFKENTEDDNYDDFLDQYKIKALVEKYSNYIRYPIKMLVTKTRQSEDSTEDDPKYEDYKDYDILNSNEPIWKKKKSDLKDEDYINFYRESHYGFDEPLSWVHFAVEGLVSFRALLYIPKKAPFDFYSKDYKKGLELYSHGVKIMDRSEDLLDDSFSFVKGVVDSDDISLNISRETLQQDRQVRLIAKQINKKIKQALEDLMKNDREKYETFFKEFGNSLKVAIYESFGANKADLEDLLLFNSRKEDKLISLAEYKENMKSTDENILYAVGDSLEKIKNSPALALVDQDRDVLLLDEKLDEFLIKMLKDYKDLPFKSINQEEEKESEEKDEALTKLVDFVKENTPEDVVDVRFTDKLADLPSMIKQRGEVSIEMEKTLKDQPQAMGIKADKVLEINKSTKAFDILKENMDKDEDKAKMIVNLLLDQARLMEGLEIDDPVAYTKNIWKLI